jgi:hypothetical protein
MGSDGGQGVEAGGFLVERGVACWMARYEHRLKRTEHRLKREAQNAQRDRMLLQHPPAVAQKQLMLRQHPPPAAKSPLWEAREASFLNYYFKRKKKIYYFSFSH